MCKRGSRARALGGVLLLASLACGNRSAAPVADARPQDSDAAMAERTEAVVQELLGDHPRVAPEPPLLPLSRETLPGAHVLRQLRTAPDAAAREALWAKTFAGKPVAGHGVLVVQAPMADPTDPEAPPVTGFGVDVDGDWKADVTAVYFETNPNRIPYVEPGQWLWYEGRLHAYDDSVSPLTLTVGAYTLTIQ